MVQDKQHTSHDYDRHDHYDVYGLGAALVDTEIEVTDEDLARLGIEKGLMTLVDEARQHELMDALKDHMVASSRASGGSAANSMIAISGFGGRTFFSCRVANDDNGHFYLNDLARAEVSYRNGVLPEGITGKCLVLITPDAERTMNSFLGISETLASDHLSPDALLRSKTLYVEGYLVTSSTGRGAALKAIELAKENGVEVALSLSDPGIVQHFRDGLAEMVGGGIDLIFCNRDEALQWTGSDNLEQAAEEMKRSARQFAITMSGDGARVWDGEQLQTVPGTPVTAVDTNGAGDMFAGAYLYARSQGHPAARCAAFANLAAATVVGQYGPRLESSQCHMIARNFDWNS